VSKRKKRGRQNSERPRGETIAQLPAETRWAEVTTVGWMLSTLLTGAAELVGGAIAVGMWLQPEGATLPALGLVFLLIALIVGSASLVLAGVVAKSRRVPAPRGVTIVALAIGILPWAVVCYRLLW
jgi:hypothetical protein